jgi:hypothetical protein
MGTTEVIDLLGAVARRDWDTVDRLRVDLDGTEVETALKAAFGLAVAHRFPDGDPGAVARFVREYRAGAPPEERGHVRRLATEGLIRFALGETDLADELVWDDDSFAVMVQVLITLLVEAAYDEEALATYLAAVADLAATHAA